MFAGLDAGLGSPIPPAGMNPAQPAMAAGGMAPEPAGGSRKYFIVGFLVLLLIGIGVGGYFAYVKFSSMVSETEEQPAAVETSDDTAAPAAVKPAVETAETATTTEVAAATSTATTSPLAGVETATTTPEAVATTTPAATTTAVAADRTKDSDSDGLTDYEETNFYQTNLSIADTDGDGFSDGAEVKNGFNPLGAGKMIDNKIKPQ